MTTDAFVAWIMTPGGETFEEYLLREPLLVEQPIHYGADRDFTRQVAFPMLTMCSAHDLPICGNVASVVPMCTLITASQSITIGDALDISMATTS